ncbi:RpiB/LacA/LacB family sugar-phosphate isomerase [Candidatus Dependentiae bacterium]
MKIAIGSDHRGFDQKNFIIQQIKKVAWKDVGCFSDKRCDYPEFAHLVVKALIAKEADLGVLLCGSGIGMSIAANRFKGIYAGLCWSVEVAKAARQDDNINILVLPADFISSQQSVDIVHAWLSVTFKGGRYQDRLHQIDELKK